MKRFLIAIAIMVFGVGSASATTVTLPTVLGSSTMPEYITQAITSMGAIVITALGGYFAFLLIRKGLKWIRMAL